MTSYRKIIANRRNAPNSTGPRSPGGRARSSRNSLKHGLTAKQVVLSNEDPAEYDNLRAAIFDYYRPTNPIAEHLVDVVASGMWRLRRVPKIEAGLFQYGTGDLSDAFVISESSLASLLRIASRIEAWVYRAIRELDRMTAERDEAATHDAVIDVEEQDVVEMPESDESKRAEARQDSETAEGAAVIEMSAEKRDRPRLRRRD